MSFAYFFSSASVIISAKRSLSVFWSILSGSMYFYEKHIIVKPVLFVLLVAGAVLLAVLDGLTMLFLFGILSLDHYNNRTTQGGGEDSEKIYRNSP